VLLYVTILIYSHRHLACWVWKHLSDRGTGFWVPSETTSNTSSQTTCLFWLVVLSILKHMKVSWDDEIPNIWKVTKFLFQTTNQSFLCLQEVIGVGRHRWQHWGLKERYLLNPTGFHPARLGNNYRPRICEHVQIIIHTPRKQFWVFPYFLKIDNIIYT